MNIHNFVSGLNNAQNSNLEKFSVKKSNIIRRVINIMVENGYLSGFSEDQHNLNVNLKYPLINKIKIEMVSKPSKRVYMGIKSIKNSSDLLIFSTEGGIFSNTGNVIDKSHGGEVLIKIVN
jgi:ribosomal protein S8